MVVYTVAVPKGAAAAQAVAVEQRMAKLFDQAVVVLEVIADLVVDKETAAALLH